MASQALASAKKRPGHALKKELADYEVFEMCCDAPAFESEDQDRWFIWLEGTEKGHVLVLLLA